MPISKNIGLNKILRLTAETLFAIITRRDIFGNSMIRLRRPSIYWLDIACSINDGRCICRTLGQTRWKYKKKIWWTVWKYFLENYFSFLKNIFYYLFLVFFLYFFIKQLKTSKFFKKFFFLFYCYTFQKLFFENN